MKIYFDKKKYKKLVLSKYRTYENYSNVLMEEYNLQKTKEAVTKWGQESNNNVPTVGDLPIIAQSLNLTVNDLFDDSEIAKEKVLKDILNNPTDRLKYLLDNYLNKASSTYIQGNIIGNKNNGNSITLNKKENIQYDQMLEEIIEVLQNDKNLKRDVYFLVFRDEIKNKEKL